MEETFDDFVYLFESIAYICHTDYKEVCVWIFGIIWPAITFLLAIKAFTNKTKKVLVRKVI
jgi:hypothetical protein